MTRNLVFTLLFLFSLNNISLAQAWQPLFDGHSFHGWMHQDGRAVDAPAWEVSDGMLHLDRRRGEGGNLLTQARYGDFELVFEWKLASGSNNGLKYRVNDFDGRYLGIEYQMIDEVAKPQKPKHRTASLYDIYEPRAHGVLRPAGEFNCSRILVCNNHIQHWLNGHLVTTATVGSQQWQQHIAESKFSDVEGFGVIPTGHIMLTDHGDEVWYRSLFIRRLDGPAQMRLASRFSAAKTRCVGRRRILSGHRWALFRRR